MRLNSIDPKISSAFKSVPAGMEVLVDSIYHILPISGKSDGTVKMPATLKFFGTVVGQADAAGVPTTLEDTNMESANAIGDPYIFWGQHIQAFILPAKANLTPAIALIDKTNPEMSLANDAAQILNRGSVTISVQNQPLAIIAPVGTIPAGMGQIGVGYGSFDTNLGNTTSVNGTPSVDNGYPIDLYLEKLLTFGFKVEFPSQFAVYNDLRLGFRIVGFKMRPRLGA